MTWIHNRRSTSEINREIATTIAERDAVQRKLWTLYAERWFMGPTLEGCHLWGGVIAQSGYGTLGKQYAHRLMWERENGPIPPYLTVDHLCQNRACVNIAHMELVTIGENARRRGERRTHCDRGHALTEENLVRWAGRGAARCATCYYEWYEDYKAKMRAKRAA